MFCDSHCHIFKEYYENIDEVINNAKENGINRLIVAADNQKSCEEVLELVNKYDNVYGCLGLHPENCLEEFDYNILKTNNKKIVAIGEIGLDYYWTKETKEKQQEILRKQLKIAEELDLPVVIHSREATLDTINILKEFNVRGVIHSFSGSLETAKIYLSMGFKLGVNGVITFKNCNLKDVYIKLDPSDIVLETDSPYLSPVPYRGEQNEPARVKDIAMFMANLYNINLKDLEEITNKNIKEIFDI